MCWMTYNKDNNEKRKLKGKNRGGRGLKKKRKEGWTEYGGQKMEVPETGWCVCVGYSALSLDFGSAFFWGVLYFFLFPRERGVCLRVVSKEQRVRSG